MEEKNPRADTRLLERIRDFKSRFRSLDTLPSCGCQAAYGSKGRPELTVQNWESYIARKMGPDDMCGGVEKAKWKVV